MTPGIPGTGIGGLFYILSALFMPLVEVFNLSRNPDKQSPWLQIITQFSIAAGILLALALTAWLILPEPTATLANGTEAVTTGLVNQQAGESNSLIKFLFIFGTLGVLLFVLSMVQLLRHLVRSNPAASTFPSEAIHVASEE